MAVAFRGVVLVREFGPWKAANPPLMLPSDIVDPIEGQSASRIEVKMSWIVKSSFPYIAPAGIAVFERFPF